MASEPIRSTSIQAAPKDYSIPAAQQIRLLSVTAQFIDNGAAGDWLPAVVILDNNGNALCRAVDQGVKVTAGSDAEVSWFPGVKAGGGAAGAIVAWGRVTGSGTFQTIDGDPASGNPTLLEWDQFSFGEDGSGVFSFDPLAPTYLQCSITPQPGYFLAHAFFEHDNDIPTALTFEDVRAGFIDEAPVGGGGALTSAKSLLSGDNGFPNQPGAKFGWGVTAWFASRGDPTPIGIELLVYNYAAAGVFLNAAPVSFAVSLVAA